MTISGQAADLLAAAQAAAQLQVPPRAQSSELAKALLAFQADPPAVHLDATNPHFHSRFASLAGVMAAVRPALNKHGLVITQLGHYTDTGERQLLETTLIFAETGERLTSRILLMPTKEDPQAQGSALTYARRYALLAILGLVGDDDDDDANAATPGNGVTFKSTGSSPPPVDDKPHPDPVIHFGRNSGTRLSELKPKQLEWYATQWTPNPEYANDQDYALKAAAEALHLGIPVGAQEVTDDLDGIPF